MTLIPLLKPPTNAKFLPDNPTTTIGASTARLALKSRPTPLQPTARLRRAARAMPRLCDGQIWKERKNVLRWL